MTHKNVELVEQPEPLVVDHEWTTRGVVDDRWFVHTLVLWKGNHVLTIKKSVEYADGRAARFRASFDEDDVDDDEMPSPPKSQDTVKWIVHTAKDWDWLTPHYGTFGNLNEAKEVAEKAVIQIMDHIRKAFMLKDIR